MHFRRKKTTGNLMQNINYRDSVERVNMNIYEYISSPVLTSTFKTLFIQTFVPFDEFVCVFFLSFFPSFTLFVSFLVNTIDFFIFEYDLQNMLLVMSFLLITIFLLFCWIVIYIFMSVRFVNMLLCLVSRMYI